MDDLRAPAVPQPDRTRDARFARLAARALGVPSATLTLDGVATDWGPRWARAPVTERVLSAGHPVTLDDAAGVPVMLELRVVGVLGVAAGQTRHWSAEYLGVLGEVAGAVTGELEREAAASAEAEARQTAAGSTTLLDSLLATTPAAVAFFAADLRFTRVNAAMAAMNGIPADAHVGKTVQELLPRQDPGAQAALEQVYRGGRSVLGTEVSGETPAQPGVQREWLVDYHPLLDANGAVIGVTAVATEVTERKRGERERTQLLAAEQLARVESERAARRLAALQAITAKLSGAGTLDEVTEVLGDQVRALLGLRGAALLLLGDDGRLSPVRAFGVLDAGDGDLAGDEALGEALRARRVVLAAQGGDRSANGGGARAGGAPGAALPLVVDGRTMGALALSWESGPPVDAGGLLAALADQFAQAIERSRLRKAEQDATRRLAFLAEASRVLSASLDARETLVDLARLAVREVADACAVSIPGASGLRLAAAAHVDPERERIMLELGSAGRCGGRGPEAEAAAGSAVVADLLADDEERLAVDPEHLALLRRLGHRSVMAAPLLVRGEVLGVLALYQGPSQRRFGPRELAWMQDLTARAASALDNARLYRDRASVARTLQRSLLPPANPSIPGLEVAARYHPVDDGNKVGGDFYDLFPLGRESWGVVMGDVSGKGVAAASLTALSRYTVRAAALHLDEPSAVLSTLDRAILDADFEERFCTIVYLSVEEGDGSARLRLCRGGHPPPLLVAADGTIRPVGEDGAAIGLLPEPDLIATDIELGPGDALVLYTDGVLEARSACGVWGEDLLESVLAETAGQGATALADAVASAVLAFSDGAPRDDVAILVLRVPAEQRVGEVLDEVLPPEPVAAAQARGMLRDWLEAGPRDDDVLLVVTELISNAARVARSAIALRTWRTPSAVMVEVSDDGEGFAPHTPRGAAPAFEAESGRGLFLVSELADDVQITSTSAGTAVRCRLELAFADR